MVFFRVALCRSVALSLLGYDMNEHRFILDILRVLNIIYQFTDIMSVDRSHICKAEFFKHNVWENEELDPVFQSLKSVAHRGSDNRNTLKPA